MKRWTEQESEHLRDVFARLPLEELMSVFGRSENAIRIRARKLGLSRPGAVSPYGSLQRLLEDTPQAAYWNGFIAADGSFTRRRLRVVVHRRDREHIENFVRWLGATTPVAEAQRNAVRFAMSDTPTVQALREKFDLHERKTYVPPQRLPYEDETLLRAWLLGYIDGDGEVRKQTGREVATLNTVAHLSWKPFLEALSKRLGFGYVTERSGHADYPERRYAALRCARHNDIAELKTFARDHGLPVLERKWSKVDTGIVIERFERAERMRELIRSGHRTNDIALQIGCGKSAVSNMRRRMAV